MLLNKSPNILLANKSMIILVSRGQTLFQRRGLSIRDYKHPRARWKGSGPSHSTEPSWWCWVLNVTRHCHTHLNAAYRLTWLSDNVRWRIVDWHSSCIVDESVTRGPQLSWNLVQPLWNLNEIWNHTSFWNLKYLQMMVNFQKCFRLFPYTKHHVLKYEILKSCSKTLKSCQNEISYSLFSSCGPLGVSRTSQHCDLDQTLFSVGAYNR